MEISWFIASTVESFNVKRPSLGSVTLNHYCSTKTLNFKPTLFSIKDSMLWHGKEQDWTYSDIQIVIEHFSDDSAVSQHDWALKIPKLNASTYIKGHSWDLEWVEANCDEFLSLEPFRITTARSLKSVTLTLTEILIYRELLLLFKFFSPSNYWRVSLWHTRKRYRIGYPIKRALY